MVKKKITHRFLKYQVVLTKFNNLKIIYTPGSNLAFPDLLSQNVPIADIKRYQLEHKTIPNDIKFILDNGEQICYSVLHRDDNNIFQNDCDPVIAQVQGGKKKLINISDRRDFSLEDALEHFEESCSAIQNITDFFRFGKQINQIKRLSIPDINNETFMKKSQMKYLHLMILWKIQNGLTYMKAMLRTTFSTIWIKQKVSMLPKQDL